MGGYFHVCLSADLFMVHLQVYRIFTSPFFHGSFRDMVSNLLAFALAGSYIERNMGTVIFTWLLVIIQLATSLLNMIAGVVLSTSWVIPVGSSLHYAQEHMRCTYGISGVVCALATFNIFYKHHQSKAHEVHADLSPHSWMGGVAHLLVTPAHMLSWIFVVTIMIGLPGLALKYASGAMVGLLAALVYEKFALPLPYILEYEEYARRHGWFTSIDGLFKPCAESLPRPPPAPLPLLSETMTTVPLAEMVATQRVSSLAKIQTPLSSFGVASL